MENVCFPAGALRTVRLVSSECDFFCEVRAGDVYEQRLTVTRDGHVWLTNYRYGEERETNVPPERQQFRIAREAADAILNAVGTAFQRHDDQPMIPDAGCWALTLTDAKGRQLRASGSLLPDAGTAFAGLSDLIRNALQRNDLLLFDGHPN